MKPLAAPVSQQEHVRAPVLTQCHNNSAGVTLLLPGASFVTNTWAHVVRMAVMDACPPDMGL